MRSLWWTTRLPQTRAATSVQGGRTGNAATFGARPCFGGRTPRRAGAGQARAPACGDECHGAQRVDGQPARGALGRIARAGQLAATDDGTGLRGRRLPGHLLFRAAAPPALAWRNVRPLDRPPPDDPPARAVAAKPPRRAPAGSRSGVLAVSPRHRAV